MMTVCYRRVRGGAGLVTVVCVAIAAQGGRLPVSVAPALTTAWPRGVLLVDLAGAGVRRYPDRLPDGLRTTSGDYCRHWQLPTAEELRLTGGWPGIRALLARTRGLDGQPLDAVVDLGDINAPDGLPTEALAAADVLVLTGPSTADMAEDVAWLRAVLGEAMPTLVLLRLHDFERGEPNPAHGSDPVATLPTPPSQFANVYHQREWHRGIHTAAHDLRDLAHHICVTRPPAASSRPAGRVHRARHHQQPPPAPPIARPFSELGRTAPPRAPAQPAATPPPGLSPWSGSLPASEAHQQAAMTGNLRPILDTAHALPGQPTLPGEAHLPAGGAAFTSTPPDRRGGGPPEAGAAGLGSSVVDLPPELAEDGPLVLLLGPVDVRNPAGNPREAHREQNRQLLAYLAWHPGRPADEMVHAIWRGEPSRAAKSKALARLRNWLGNAPDGQPYGPTGQRVSLHPQLRSDWQQFLNLVQHRTGETDAPRALHLRHALRLIRGPLLGGIDATWAEAIRQRMREVILPAAVTCAHLHLTLGQHERALEAIRHGQHADQRGENDGLWQALLRTQHAAGHIDQLHASYTTYLHQRDGHPNEHTAMLFKQLTTAP